jgi:hypothetical protein
MGPVTTVTTAPNTPDADAAAQPASEPASAPPTGGVADAAVRREDNDIERWLAAGVEEAGYGYGV